MASRTMRCVIAPLDSVELNLGSDGNGTLNGLPDLQPGTLVYVNGHVGPPVRVVVALDDSAIVEST